MSEQSENSMAEKSKKEEESTNLVCKLDLSNLSSIENALESNERLSLIIDKLTQGYDTIDVGVTMKKLKSIGEILKLAYAGSKGMKCSKSVMRILCKYQTMTNHALVASGSFVEACLVSLFNHKNALKFAEKGKLETALVFLKKCSQEASLMAEECGKLINETKELLELSTNALTEAQEDENISVNDRNEIKKIIAESQAKRVEAETKVKQLHEQIEEYRKKQSELAEKADVERAREFYLKMVSTTLSPVNNAVTVLSPVKNIANAAANATQAVCVVAKTVENALKGNDSPETSAKDENSKESSACLSLVEQENLIIKLKNELLKEEREANAKIAELGERIKSYKDKDEDLNAAISSLDIAIKALGKVKTIFEYTQQYWLGVQKRCERLANIDLLVELQKDADFKEEFIEGLRVSALNWLALGKNNRLAHKSIKKVADGYNDIMSNLPDRNDAKQIIDNSDKIISELTVETYRE